eukprot:7607899-Lingulodinium_polyedra.AAC.1
MRVAFDEGSRIIALVRLFLRSGARRAQRHRGRMFSVAEGFHSGEARRVEAAFGRGARRRPA